ncbi:hypothetical protein E2562_030654 [Oryza meyeriana var. granulata]|uniref:DUF834 domain-containing protein n=1 Tax=Oryza meyeriana var. granulata TaxID=110450 RepID=A0A6G1D9D4_9ORYZ|nr:hypothetical protein E2562_030654 [Oryza meyeriana var. granulata]
MTKTKEGKNHTLGDDAPDLGFGWDAGSKLGRRDGAEDRVTGDGELGWDRTPGVESDGAAAIGDDYAARRLGTTARHGVQGQPSVEVGRGDTAIWNGRRSRWRGDRRWKEVGAQIIDGRRAVRRGDCGRVGGDQG